MDFDFESLTNAINDLFEDQEADRQAEEELIIAPRNLTEGIDEIESKFEQLQTAVNEHGPGYAESISVKLDAAFEELYHLAVFVGGDPVGQQLSLSQDEFEALQVSVMVKRLRSREIGPGKLFVPLTPR